MVFLIFSGTKSWNTKLQPNLSASLLNFFALTNFLKCSLVTGKMSMANGFTVAERVFKLLLGGLSLPSELSPITKLPPFSFTTAPYFSSETDSPADFSFPRQHEIPTHNSSAVPVILLEFKTDITFLRETQLAISSSYVLLKESCQFKKNKSSAQDPMMSFVYKRTAVCHTLEIDTC